MAPVSGSLVLGVDSSTQSTKVEARHIETGRIVARGEAPHAATEPPISEQDPASWWQALTTAIEALGDIRSQVVAMAIAGQQHGLVLIDAQDDVVRPAKLWNDVTSAPQATAIVERLSPEVWAGGCGSVPLASFTVAKLAWVAEHEPEALDRTAKVMLPHDYLTWRLTGEHVTDRGDASGTGWFDPSENRYRSELLAAAVAPAEPWLDRLPRIAPHDAPVGELSQAAAATLGLRPGVLVGAGTGDNMAAAMGLGLQPGDIAMSLGTSGTVYAVSARATADASGCVAGFADALGGFLPLVCTLNATKVTDTVARWVGTDAAGLSSLAAMAPSGFEGVVLVPYFDGERTPNLPAATGGLSGLRTTTSVETLARAAHDGVLCGLLSGLDALGAAGVETGGRLHLIGGGARSGTYRQRCADLHRSPIVVPDADETVATGAALQAAAIASEPAAAAIAAAWDLGTGETIEPLSSKTEAREVRAAYADAVTDYSPLV